MRDAHGMSVIEKEHVVLGHGEGDIDLREQPGFPAQSKETDRIVLIIGSDLPDHRSIRIIHCIICEGAGRPIIQSEPQGGHDPFVGDLVLNEKPALLWTNLPDVVAASNADVGRLNAVVDLYRCTHPRTAHIHPLVLQQLVLKTKTHFMGRIREPVHLGLQGVFPRIMIVPQRGYPAVVVQSVPGQYIIDPRRISRVENADRICDDVRRVEDLIHCFVPEGPPIGIGPKIGEQPTKGNAQSPAFVDQVPEVDRRQIGVVGVGGRIVQVE